jgi:restriction system protein
MATNEHSASVFLVRAGRGGEDEAYALEHGRAIIGFQAYPSLQGIADYTTLYELVRKSAPEMTPRGAGNHAGQLWTFCVLMKEGDLVILPRKLTAQVAIGRVTGPYAHMLVDGVARHTRPVEWIKTEIPRSVFGQDLLNSFGAFLTVCRIARNEAERRIAAVLAGQPDPGLSVAASVTAPGAAPSVVEVTEPHDLSLAAHDQIVARIQERFKEHELSRLVEAVLRADGWVTKLSPPGPDGGVDVLAGRGPLGLDAPRLCVQVKSGSTPADVTVYRTLQGSMQSFKAEQGLLVSWAGFNRVVQNEARQGHFSVRLWDSDDLVEAIYRNYERLPAEIQAELPLKRVWMLVADQEQD